MVRGGLWVVLLLFTATVGDSQNLNPAQRASASHRYDLVLWHASNSLDKWLHIASRAMPWNRLTVDERRHAVEEYFSLSQRLSAAEAELDRLKSSGDASADEVARLTAEVKEVAAALERDRSDVEEALEAAISSVAAEEGIGFGRLVLPPVDIRLTVPPKLLVTSSRERIERLHDVLLSPDVEIGDREEIEREMLDEANLSALVTNIGGVATYPASIPWNRSLESTLRVAAHEWLHHYFFFKPLGQNMFKSGEMQTLNETAADIIGREIGHRALASLGMPHEEPADAPPGHGNDEPDREGFDFGEEMRQTRLRVDELLASGQIAEAERYMEERRERFQQHRFNIRKLNQAYFAFHGTYAESPSSVSPIGGWLNEMRELVPDLGEFIAVVAGISSYEEFIERLDEIRLGTAAEPSGARLWEGLGPRLGRGL